MDTFGQYRNPDYKPNNQKQEPIDWRKEWELTQKAIHDAWNFPKLKYKQWQAMNLTPEQWLELNPGKTTKDYYNWKYKRNLRYYPKNHGFLGNGSNWLGRSFRRF